MTETTCEYLANPLGIDTPKPRFGWVLQSGRNGTMQRAYQVLVADSPEELTRERGDLWDTGKIESDESVNIEYQGKPLASRQRCFWKVRVWDDQGHRSPWSETARFEMGLLEPSDWHGRWIGLGGENTAAISPLLRKEFRVEGPIRRARLYAAGIGWSEYHLNGKRVGDSVLDPATTDYDKRILYVTHDVTGLLQPGDNALGAMLGNGWYSPPVEKGYGDAPQLLLELVVELDDGAVQRIVSDESWRTSAGPILHNSLWGGETYDARLEKTGWTESGYDDSSWLSAAEKPSPGGRLEAQMLEPIKVNRILKPVEMTQPSPGVYVYDFGQLFGGWARFRVKGPAGAKIALRYAERIFPDTGLADKRRHYLAPDGATDFYTLKGDPAGEWYEPRFALHALRYVQVEGLVKEPELTDIEGCVVHSSVDLAGDFECSNPLLNRIHRNCMWTLGNALYGIELDCLFREHWSWLEPASSPAFFFARKHIPQFITKYLADAQCAQHDDGVIPDVIPNYPQKNRHTGDPAWAGNYPMVVWYAYQYYGDRRLIEQHYPSMKRWVSHLTSTAESHLIQTGMYGDHMLPGDAPGREVFISKETPSPLIWTGYYYRNVWIMAQAANVLGLSGDAKSYEQLAEDIRDALNATWLDESKNCYAAGSQTSNIFPLALGIVPKANQAGLLNNLAENILQKCQGHLYMGNIGTTCATSAMASLGRGDVLYRVATATDYPGWGYMVEQGATTIWECWGGIAPGPNAVKGIEVSEDSMPMFMSIEEFFYGGLAGIQGPEYFGSRISKPGFREICIRPNVAGDLTSASAHIRTVRGLVHVDWKRENNAIILKATIPANARASISIPMIGLHDVTVEESGRILWEKGAYRGGIPGITAGTEEPEYITFDAGSGSYHFILRGRAGL
ncbi:MAG: family 78 glycoside hydrolase catalytic domain [Phycisphaerae bacterium]|nr:family 78 glycoside hydrolase catalytic domain [Phycisphaerae bacterium]